MAKTHTSLLDEIVHDHEKFEVYIGLAGDTGMGKTSLLNALLYGSGDIAPSSQHGACTSAICCFKYHQPAEDNHKHKFKATIRLKSKSAVDLEISRFFQDLEALDDREDEDDTITRAERQGLKAELGRICSWSGLSANDVNQLGSANYSAITSECKRSAEFFNHTQPDQSVQIEFSSPNAGSFAQELRRYVSSAGSKSKKSEVYWPIVEQAYIYSPSNLLSQCPGLVLVDMPGETDASEARSEVARRSYNKMDRLLVLTPSDRACDNKTAADFILEEHLCDIEADGKMDRDFLAVVISKIDLLNWRQFVENEVDASAISPSFSTILETLVSQEHRLEEIRESLELTKEKIADLEEQGSIQHLGSLKRNRGTTSAPELTDLITELTKEELRLLNEQKTLEAYMKDIDERCLRECIEFRSRDIETTFSRCFDEIRGNHHVGGGEQVRSSNIRVLPVSSAAQRSLFRGKPMTGFSNATDTGFEALDRWIIESSFPKREEHADNIIHRCLVLFDAVEGWIRAETISTHIQLPKSELKEIKAVIAKFNDDFQQESEKRVVNFHRFLNRQEVFKAPSQTQSDRQDMLVDAFQSAVSKFYRSQEPRHPPLHWSTFGACLRRNGGPYKTSSKPPKLHDLQSQAYAAYWRRDAKYWSKAFADALPRYASLMIYNKRRQVSKYEDLFRSSELPLAFKDALRQAAYRMDHYNRSYRSEIEDMVNTCRRDSGHIRLRSREAMKTSLMPLFREANQETGKGMWNRQKAIVQAFAEKESEHIVAVDIGSKMTSGLKALKQKATERCKTIDKRLLKQISKLALDVAKQLCSAKGEGDKKDDPRTESLKTELRGHFQAWDEHWKWLKPQIPDINIHLPVNCDFAGLDDDDDDDDREVKHEVSDNGQRLSTKPPSQPAKGVKKRKGMERKPAAKLKGQPVAKKERKNVPQKSPPASTTASPSGDA